jgi:hypothetical protein
MPIQVWIDMGGGVIRKYFTSVLHFKGSNTVQDNGSSSGIISFTPQATKIIYATFDGQPDNAISAGHFGKILPLGISGTITKVRMTTDIDCNVEVSIWKDVIANGDPTISDDITGGNPPTMVGAKYVDCDLSGWNLAVDEDDVWYIKITSIDDDVRYLQIQIEVTA